jgi:hypothetical protein
MMFRILALLLFPVICLAQVNSNGEKPTGELLTNEISPNEMKRNASFNLDEIKVRWKKAALENCTGAPCASISAPGPVTSIAATPTGPNSVSVAFVPPASTGGSPITGYEATATPTSSAPAKRKSSATITVKGDKSPIEIKNLTPGQNYIFTVVALNAAGGSTPTPTVIPVAPCTLNTVAEFGTKNGVVGSNFNQSINTTGATGKGTATGLPPGLQAFSFETSGGEKGIEISGVPTASGTFKFEIPLTGGCGSVKATGTIVVEAPQCRVDITGNTLFPSGVQIVEPVTLFTTSGVTGIGTPTGIPDGMYVEWNNESKQIMIKGRAPINNGQQPVEYIFAIPLTVGSGCNLLNAEGQITIFPVI